MILSIDMSLRSSGVVIMDDDDSIVHFESIKTTSKDFPFDEEMIIHVDNRIEHLMYKNPKIDKFVIEGMSHGSNSGRKDVIAGLHWSIRTTIRRRFPWVLIGCVPVNSWRNWATTKEERSSSKKSCPDSLKNVSVMKLPQEIYDIFLRYVIMEEMDVKTMFDLADAYWLARYRNFLERKGK